MGDRGFIKRHGFWPLALLWLPAGIVLTAVFRFMPEPGLPAELGMWLSLIVVAPCGLPLALACRRLWRLGFRRAAGVTGTCIGIVSVAVSLLAGLLGPLAIAIAATVLSLPVWIVAWLKSKSMKSMGSDSID